MTSEPYWTVYEERMARLRTYVFGDPYPTAADVLWLISELDYHHAALMGLCQDSEAAAQALRYRRALARIVQLHCEDVSKFGHWWEVADAMRDTAIQALEEVI